MSRSLTIEFGSLARSDGAIPSMGCVVPQPFAAGGNRSYLDFSVVTGDRRYLGYKTPIVAPEPSVEQVAGAGHSMGGIIGTHMMLWVPLRESEV
jgi:hypothetical protein